MVKKKPSRSPSRKTRVPAPRSASPPKSVISRLAAGESRSNNVLRRQLGRLLRGEGAHLSYAEALRSFPVHLAGEKAHGVPHTAWQLLEHLRIAQADMIEFSRSPDHVSPAFPEGYWPATMEPPSAEAWNDSVKAFLRDLDQFIKWVGSPRTALLADLHDGEGPPLLREAFLIADHNAYHLGQIVQIQRALESRAGA